MQPKTASAPGAQIDIEQNDSDSSSTATATPDHANVPSIFMTVDAVAEISEVGDAVGDVADSMMTVEGTEIVIQDGATEVVVQVVRVVSASHLNFSLTYSLT